MELKLSVSEQRLGEAFVRLNKMEWDDLLGDKPAGFDDLPDVADGKCKMDYLMPAMTLIEVLLTPAGASRYWWIIALGKSNAEWRTWWDLRYGRESRRELHDLD